MTDFRIETDRMILAYFIRPKQPRLVRASMEICC